ncbi:helix-turn-helix transcriptional regulator [Brassicibacter mesophilus]|uniref:helix-turn-helix transcriptional regulator n=1 Tax=Brassicibacter mesophilus TaxID=745119 RepID=UPI003D1A34BD
MRIHRLLGILLLLESRECIKAKDLAEAFEVSKRTVHRDIDILCECGVPITSIAGPVGGYSLMNGYTLNIKTMNVDELITLYLSGMGLHPTKYSNANINLKNAILKLENTVPQKYSEDIQKAKERFHFDPDSWWKSNINIPHLDTLRKALMQSKKIELTYTNSSMGTHQTKTRIIRPYGLVVKNSEWYLVAFCESKNALRVFKCNRVSEALKLDDTFSIPCDFQLESFWKKWIVNFKQLLSEVPFYPVSLRLLSITKEELVKMDIIEQSQLNKEDIILVNLYTYDNACKRIIEYGNTIEVLSPELLRNFVINSAKDIINIYLGN